MESTPFIKSIKEVYQRIWEEPFIESMTSFIDSIESTPYIQSTQSTPVIWIPFLESIKGVCQRTWMASFIDVFHRVYDSFSKVYGVNSSSINSFNGVYGVYGVYSFHCLTDAFHRRLSQSLWLLSESMTSFIESMESTPFIKSIKEVYQRIWEEPFDVFHRVYDFFHTVYDSLHGVYGFNSCDINSFCRVYRVYFWHRVYNRSLTTNISVPS